MRSKRFLRGAAVLACLALGACGQGAATPGEQVYTWDMTVTTGESSTWYQAAQRFADTLERESDGRMRLRVFTGEQLSSGDPAAGVEQLMSGDKDFSYNSTIIYAGIDPRFGAINAPFLYQNHEEADRAIDGGAREAYEDLSAEFGVTMLGFGESGFRQVTNNVRPIREPADLDGIKIRIPGIGLFTDVYRDLGANPTTMNFSEVFTSLQQGTIEGQENPMDVISSAGLAEVQEYLTIWNYVYDPLILGMNQELFESLSPDDRRIVTEAAEDANEFQVQASRELEQAQIDEQSELMDVTRLTDAQVERFQQAVRPLYDEYERVWGPTLTDAVTPEG
ncbi:C4-dicarboxylate ABC transporter substrate-binding protein [Saccharomonospora piscinae]|uniref:C4-dicarboxylate ABC transporter substrate-binding protein n=1 Tax=Saccharomonospora piscinae TaxID=687388 RepID=A0A1V9A4D9_SACPI|nr:DctP family TRAP transporter solute-binding subunit [Saccharomonospora piscinae]OQO92012.1 C4-dicarboxylate ABC transporter substrate-binding protein [Saccharomonospora piscinae]